MESAPDLKRSINIIPLGTCTSESILLAFSRYILNLQEQNLSLVQDSAVSDLLSCRDEIFTPV
jgi:hypothetical protein